MGRKDSNCNKQMKSLFLYIDETMQSIKGEISSMFGVHGGTDPAHSLSDSSSTEHNDHGYTGMSKHDAYHGYAGMSKYDAYHGYTGMSKHDAYHGNIDEYDPPPNININVNSSANHYAHSSAAANVGGPSPTKSGIQRSAPVTRSNPHSFCGTHSMNSQPGNQRSDPVKRNTGQNIGTDSDEICLTTLGSRECYCRKPNGEVYHADPTRCGIQFQNVNVNSSADYGGDSSAHGNVYSSSGVDPHAFGNVNVNSSADHYGQSSAVANVNAPPPTRSGIQRSAPVTRSGPQNFCGSQSMNSQHEIQKSAPVTRSSPKKHCGSQSKNSQHGIQKSAPVTRSDPQQGIQKCYQDINNTLRDLERCLDNILAKLG